MRTDASTTSAAVPALFFKRFEECMKASQVAAEYAPEVDGFVLQHSASSADEIEPPIGGTSTADYINGKLYLDADFVP
ncbi:hypothetical protein D187_003871 [Cystobacter fuscus DSM 2262]|uniref:Uncharacterized protein n=1 Tax=Cystobacter fuscus (strain ATCC 25194 / DSM 2262 / NBRC 100088 / M29) TaxID=1242864 RepID=S9QQ10_CYSF2|nr:hypothetical protein [Cystobacter fuscus]EPX58673.1 hypothetical protein D187_003871 [Cystobacter fuscus DSM 2262]